MSRHVLAELVVEMCCEDRRERPTLLQAGRGRLYEVGVESVITTTMIKNRLSLKVVE